MRDVHPSQTLQIQRTVDDLRESIQRYNEKAEELHSAGKQVKRDEIQHRLLRLKSHIKQKQYSILGSTGINLVPTLPHDTDVFEYFNVQSVGPFAQPQHAIGRALSSPRVEHHLPAQLKQIRWNIIRNKQTFFFRICLT